MMRIDGSSSGGRLWVTANLGDFYKEEISERFGEL